MRKNGIVLANIWQPKKVFIFFLNFMFSGEKKKYEIGFMAVASIF